MSQHPAPALELLPAADAAALHSVENLMQYYMYDFSEWLPIPLGDDGRFFIRPKAEYWAQAGTHAFLIKVEGELAGFATVDRDVVDADTEFSIGYFFVSRRFRGAGLGARAAELLLQRFPGAWQVYHVSANRGAAAFWAKVIPRLTHGEFSQRSALIDDYDCTLYKFVQPTPRHQSTHGALMKITVSTVIAAPIAEVWRLYNSPEDVKVWNTASPDWHTTASSVDLRVGGQFSSRMEAKDGSFGFDFAGEYTRVEAPTLLEYRFGDRVGRVEFAEGAAGVTVTVCFDSEPSHSEEQQRTGWQAILDSFARHVVSRQG